MAIRHSVQLAGLAVILGLPLPAAAAPRLILGRPEVTPKRTVAVPILLRARRVDRVAALNFTLQVKRPCDASLLTLEPGSVVRRADAALHVSNTAKGDAIVALVVPPFTLPLPVMSAGRVATVTLQCGRKLSPWMQRAVRLKDVVLSDTEARALRLLPRLPQRRAVRR